MNRAHTFSVEMDELTKPLRERYVFRVYAVTPGGHRFALVSCPSRESAERAIARHRGSHPLDTCELVEPGV